MSYKKLLYNLFNQYSTANRERVKAFHDIKNVMAFFLSRGVSDIQTVKVVN